MVKLWHVSQKNGVARTQRGTHLNDRVTQDNRRLQRDLRPKALSPEPMAAFKPALKLVQPTAHRDMV